MAPSNFIVHRCVCACACVCVRACRWKCVRICVCVWCASVACVGVGVCACVCVRGVLVYVRMCARLCVYVTARVFTVCSSFSFLNFSTCCSRVLESLLSWAVAAVYDCFMRDEMCNWDSRWASSSAQAIAVEIYNSTLSTQNTIK